MAPATCFGRVLIIERESAMKRDVGLGGLYTGGRGMKINMKRLCVRLGIRAVCPLSAVWMLDSRRECLFGPRRGYHVAICRIAAASSGRTFSILPSQLIFIICLAIHGVARVILRTSSTKSQLVKSDQTSTSLVNITRMVS